MNNHHDEIKKLLKASRTMLLSEKLSEDIQNIRKKYNLILEQDVESEDEESELSKTDITKKLNPARSVEKEIEFEKESSKDKKQAYRISGGIIVLHGKKQSDLEITTDEKIAFQETMEIGRAHV